jgi:transposase
MAYVGIDVHKRETQICVLDDDGTVLVEKRVRAESETLKKTFGELAAGKVLIEASTESEWVARCLEGLGREVVVADPNFAAMYATRSRKVKTDRRDARTLADACRLGAYRLAHRMSDEQRQLRKLVDSRALLVRVRTKNINFLRSALRSMGISVKACAADDFVGHFEEIVLPKAEQASVTPLVAVLKVVQAQIEKCDQKLAKTACKDERAARLMTTPGVGAVTALSFVAVIGEVERFEGPHQVSAYLGLVPCESSSGEKQHRGMITKAGNKYLRSLLVQCAWSILTRSSVRGAKMHDWALAVAQRRGKNVAVVALARKLAGVLFAMWRDKTDFEPGTQPVQAAVA